jgi:HAE1 family hydrophobic/amphiphilic exporter-1
MLGLLLRKRLGVLTLFALLLVGGVYLFSQLSIQLYPRVNRPRLTTSIRHNGYSAVNFHKEFASLIESRLLAVHGLELLEARYGSNQSSFTLTFDWRSDADTVKADTEAALTTINNSLPAELQGSVNVRFFSGENAGYLMLGLSSPSVSPEDLYKLVNTNARPRLIQVPDVDVVEIFNVEDLQANIVLRQLDMLQYGLTIVDVNSALQATSSTQSIGSLTEGPLRLSVSYTKEEPKLFDLPELVVKQLSGVPIRLKDIADVSIYYTIPSATFVMEGSRGIQVIVNPIDGGNISTMSQAVQRELAALRNEGLLPPDTAFNALLDPADYINRALSNVLQSLLLGAALAMVIVFIMLGEIRNSILIGLSIPVSLILSFIPMRGFAVSLNLISLGGMALAVGMIVDASIVVMENIHRYRVEEGHAGDARHLRELIIRAVAEVRPSIIASALTSILVFLPLSFTAPLTNAILGDQAKVVIFTLGFSLVVALVLVPVLVFMIYRKHDLRARLSDADKARRNPSEILLHHLERLYSRSLTTVVTHKAVALSLLGSLAVVLAVATFALLPRIPKEIISSPQSDRLIVFIQATNDLTSQEIVEGKLPEMTRIIRDNLSAQVTRTYAEVRGRMNRLFLVLKSTKDVAFVTAELQRLFPSDNDWYFNVMNWDPAALPLPRTNDLRIDFYGPDASVLIPLVERARDLVTETGNYARVSTTPATSYADELELKPRSETIDRVSGLTESSLLTLMRRILGGTQSRRYEHEGLSVQARAVYPSEEIRGRVNLANFLIPYRQSAIPLKHFFDFEIKSNVSQIVSENGDLIFRIYADRRRDAPASERLPMEAATKAWLADNLTLPGGYSLAFNNPAEELDSAIRSLFISLAISIALIFLLLSFQYNSFMIPLIILVAVPLGFIGLLFSLFAFKSTLSLNSLLGAILLSGIVVNNSIILIDFYLIRRREMSKIDALVQSAKVRLRPILITSLTTIFGMLPIAIGLGEGSSVVKPLGIAVSGGLAVSTILTLYVVPALLSLTNTGAKQDELA